MIYNKKEKEKEKEKEKNFIFLFTLALLKSDLFHLLLVGGISFFLIEIIFHDFLK